MDEVISGVCNNPNRGVDWGTDETIHCCELVIVETKWWEHKVYYNILSSMYEILYNKVQMGA